MTDQIIGNIRGIALRYIADDLIKMAKVAARDAGVTPKEAVDAFLEAIKDTPEYKAIDDSDMSKHATGLGWSDSDDDSR